MLIGFDVCFVSLRYGWFECDSLLSVLITFSLLLVCFLFAVLYFRGGLLAVGFADSFVTGMCFMVWWVRDFHCYACYLVIRRVDFDYYFRLYICYCCGVLLVF